LRDGPFWLTLDHLAAAAATCRKLLKNRNNAMPRVMVVVAGCAWVMDVIAVFLATKGMGARSGVGAVAGQEGGRREYSLHSAMIVWSRGAGLE